VKIVVAAVFGWYLAGFGTAQPATESCRAELQVQPWHAHVVVAGVPAEVARQLCSTTSMFPGLRPECLILADAEPVARVPLAEDGQLRFYIAANVVRDRTSLLIELRPSATQAPDGRPLAWSLAIRGCEAVQYVRQSYTIDIGHPGDVPYVGSGFSYQEGAQARQPAWAHDADFRWSRPGCRLRVPVVPGNSHTITLFGGVPVGFRVLSNERELARFERAATSGSYSFDVAPEVTADRAFLEMTLVSLDPMPLPNLDLRELFWALDRVTVETYGPGGVLDVSALPAADLADAAFRAALSVDDEAPSPVPVALRARWDLPAGYKTVAQMQQEVATVLAHGGAWFPAADTEPADTAYVSAQLLTPLWRMTGTLSAPQRGEMTADVGILITRSQRRAARLRPSTSDPLLQSARGAMRLLERLQYAVVLLDEYRLPEDGSDLPCLIVPNPTFYPVKLWRRLQGYVERGGRLIVVANLSLPFDQEPAVRALLGAVPRSYERGRFRIPVGDVEVPVYNNDWQAVLALDAAQLLLPLAPATGSGGETPVWPAVCRRELGSGRVATLALDLFRDYERYSSHLYADVLHHVLDQLGVTRALAIHGAPSVVLTRATRADGLAVYLTNVARGHYDSGGLMNAACTAIFADAIPPTPPVELTLKCATRVADVSFVPPDAAAVWKWSDGLLDITTSSIAIQQAIVVRTDASPATRVLSLPAGLPADVPLVSIAESVRADLGLVPPLQTPWPVEKVEQRPLLWLGTGPAEGLTFNVACAHPRKFLLRIEAAAGHGRTDFLRHLVLTRDGEPVWSGTLEKSAVLSASLELGPGEHRMCLYCTDEATVLKHPNGDTRNLLVALRGVTVTLTP
jgi:hypothetical protein